DCGVSLTESGILSPSSGRTPVTTMSETLAASASAAPAAAARALASDPGVVDGAVACASAAVAVVAPRAVRLAATPPSARYGSSNGRVARSDPKNTRTLRSPRQLETRCADAAPPPALGWASTKVRNCEAFSFAKRHSACCKPPGASAPPQPPPLVSPWRLAFSCEAEPGEPHEPRHPGARVRPRR